MCVWMPVHVPPVVSLESQASVCSHSVNLPLPVRLELSCTPSAYFNLYGGLSRRVCIVTEYVSMDMFMAIAIRVSQTSVAWLENVGGINGRTSSVPVFGNTA